MLSTRLADHKSRAVISAAGSRKTELVINSALSENAGRVLVTTFTNENQNQIVRRIESKVGFLPAHVEVVGWFTFLINQCAKPYQRKLTGRPLTIKGLNFQGRRNRFTPKASLRYFMDGSGKLFRDGISDFVVLLNAATRGAVVSRLRRIYSLILIDEVQDLVGYDLDFLDILIRSRIPLVVVGDPRQHILSTNLGSRNKKYAGAGLLNWFAERTDICTLQVDSPSYRCNQQICDFADLLFPEFPRTISVDVPETRHDGIFEVRRSELEPYIREFGPVTALRHNRDADTQGLRAVNIGVAKGQTFDRVLIFPTAPMLRFLKSRDPGCLSDRERLYVAATRARFSVAFVVP